MDEDKLQAGRFFIEVEGGDMDGKRVAIGHQGLLVGRSGECGLILDDREISRRHARFYFQEGYCVIEDVGSRNGIFVRGQKVKKRHLKDGDVIDLGYCKLLFNSEGSVRERPPAKKLVRLLENIEVLEDLPPPVPRRAALHPLLVAAVMFAAAAPWFWAFAVGAVLLTVISFVEIRLRGQYRGVLLAGAVLLLGVSGGAMNLWQNRARLLPHGPDDPLAAQCRGNLTRLGEALRMYVEQHEGCYPASLADLYPDYVEDPRVLSCPGAIAGGQTSVRYLLLVAGQCNLPKEAAVVCDRSYRNHGQLGGFALRAGGRVDWVNRRELEELIVGLELR